MTNLKVPSPVAGKRKIPPRLWPGSFAGAVLLLSIGALFALTARVFPSGDQPMLRTGKCRERILRTFFPSASITKSAGQESSFALASGSRGLSRLWCREKRKAICRPSGEHAGENERPPL